MFGLNPIALAKAEIKKTDFNHNRIPDAIEALEAGEVACDTLARFAKYLDKQDVIQILDKLPASLKSKMPIGEIELIAEAIVKLPGAMATAKQVLQAAEKGLNA